ncbi:MAG: hypothetical protein A2284_04070 [Deltaproteobacteria bacterium RIFOXYA12_FULL_61_11]|nr:MAG: hypothetical protein A2284_04070 [Deltaproteobacteria bacterium RIFOXYA12_FULL_61_11]
MNDKGLIAGGVLVFLALITFPLWYNAFGGNTGATVRPELEKARAGTACVANTEYMTSHHMDLLDAWREQVVRQGQHRTLTEDGRTVLMSLTLTCLDCHEHKEQFCDRCHDYAGVTPTCWDCHVDPKGRN